MVWNYIFATALKFRLTRNAVIRVISITASPPSDSYSYSFSDTTQKISIIIPSTITITIPNSISSLFSITMEAIETLGSLNGDFGFTGTDRRFAFSRQASFQHQPITPISTDSGFRKPFLSRTDSSIDIPSYGPHYHYWSSHDDKPSGSPQKTSFSSFFLSVFRNVRSGHRYMKRLFFMISLNVAYSTVELLIGLFTDRVGKIKLSTHFHFQFIF